MMIDGLVLIGGKSKRMNKDKARLMYHKKPQYAYCAELLNGVCNDVYLSVREDQLDKYESQGYGCIADSEEYAENGPLAGILSAMEFNSDVHWLVMACDLPNVTKDVLQKLIESHKDGYITAFKSEQNQLPEPLCAIYDKDSYPVLKKNFKEGIYCPRKILIENRCTLIDVNISRALDNINYADDYIAYKKEQLT